MLRKLWAIAWFSAVEVLGHPATLLLTLASAVGTLLLPLFQFQRFSEDGRLARDCGLSTALLFGTLLAIGGAGRLHRALRDGTSAIALVKPLSRGLWFCGNALGTALALGVYLLTQGAATLLAEAYSPRYHAGGSYADVWAIFMAVGVAVGALVLAALSRALGRPDGACRGGDALGPGGGPGLGVGRTVPAGADSRCHAGGVGPGVGLSRRCGLSTA